MVSRGANFSYFNVPSFASGSTKSLCESAVKINKPDKNTLCTSSQRDDEFKVKICKIN